MTLEKKNLRFEELEAQTALELPDRETFGLLPTLVDVEINCVAVCKGDIVIEDVNILNVAVICNQVSILNNILSILFRAEQVLTCGHGKH